VYFAIAFTGSAGLRSDYPSIGDETFEETKSTIESLLRGEAVGRGSGKPFKCSRFLRRPAALLSLALLAADCGP
jgi:hypothetical protein